MLDADLACGELTTTYPHLWIYWGAQLGLTDEALVSGRLVDVIDELRRTRTALRQRRGWVMDTYLLRPGVDARSADPGPR
jgi:precorrin-6A synthase